MLSIDARRQRFSGRRYSLLRGIRIVFEDAPVAAVIRALAALAAGAATGPLLVLATERFIATALQAAREQIPLAAIAAPVSVLMALFAVQISFRGERRPPSVCCSPTQATLRLVGGGV